MRAFPLKSGAELRNGGLVIAFANIGLSQIVIRVGERGGGLKCAAVDPDGGVKGVAVHQGIAEVVQNALVIRRQTLGAAQSREFQITVSAMHHFVQRYEMPAAFTRRITDYFAHRWESIKSNEKELVTAACDAICDGDSACVCEEATTRRALRALNEADTMKLDISREVKEGAPTEEEGKPPSK